MTNPNLLSFLFVFLIVSSIKLKASKDNDNDTAQHGPSNNGITLPLAFVDHSRKTLNKPITGKPIFKNAQNQFFDYIEGAPSGPKNWGNLDPEWKTCGNGKSQSPININVKQAADQQSDLKRTYTDAPAKLVNTGYSISVQWNGDAGGIIVNGSTYKLDQCHWHIPSEHKVDGKKFDAEVHFVHSNDKKENAVLGVLYAIGGPDPFIGNMTDKIKELCIGTINNGMDLGKISGNSIFFGSKKYFRYAGSLTTPPCSEGVVWTIAEKVQTISQDQIKLLKGALQQGFQENARPLQQDGSPVSQFIIPDEIQT